MEEASRSALLEESSQRWQALPQLDAAHAKAMQARYDLASAALQGDGSAEESLRDTLEQNLKHRLQLCLELEVAAGVESPPEYADERMKYQVSLLADSMQHHAEKQSREDRLMELEIAWLPDSG